MTETNVQIDIQRKRQRLLLRLVQGLLLARALLGFFIAILYVTAYPPESFLLGLLGMPALLVLNAAILLLVRWGLGRGSRPLYWVGFALMLFMLTLATLTFNELLAAGLPPGVIDIVDILLPLLVLALLVVLRRRFGVRW